MSNPGQMGKGLDDTFLFVAHVDQVRYLRELHCRTTNNDVIWKKKQLNSFPF
jgi:hypothetical protein